MEIWKHGNMGIGSVVQAYDGKIGEVKSVCNDIVGIELKDGSNKIVYYYLRQIIKTADVKDDGKYL